MGRKLRLRSCEGRDWSSNASDFASISAEKKQADDEAGSCADEHGGGGHVFDAPHVFIQLGNDSIAEHFDSGIEPFSRYYKTDAAC